MLLLLPHISNNVQMYAATLNGAARHGFAGHAGSIGNVGQGLILGKDHQPNRPYGPSIVSWPGDTWGRRMSKRPVMGLQWELDNYFAQRGVGNLPWGGNTGGGVGGVAVPLVPLVPMCPVPGGGVAPVVLPMLPPAAPPIVLVNDEEKKCIQTISALIFTFEWGQAVGGEIGPTNGEILLLRRFQETLNRTPGAERYRGELLSDMLFRTLDELHFLPHFYVAFEVERKEEGSDAVASLSEDGWYVS